MSIINKRNGFLDKQYQIIIYTDVIEINTAYTTRLLVMPECTLHEQFSSGKSYRVNSKIKVLKVLKAELFLSPPFVIAQLFKTNNFNNCVWKECLNIDRVSVRLDIWNDAFVLEKMTYMYKPSYFDSEKLMIIGTGGIRCFDLNTNFGGFPLIWYSTLHFFNFLITISKLALFNNSVICPWWPWCQQIQLYQEPNVQSLDNAWCLVFE